MENLESKKFKAIIFDLDGTLLDSFSVHYEVYKIMFERFGIHVSKEMFLNSYSPNWYKTYEAMGLSKENWHIANQLWVKEANKRNPELITGAMETLEKLNGKYPLALVTSGSRDRVMKDLTRTGINNYFITIITGDDIKNPKPSPEGLVIALNHLGFNQENVVYVGDAYDDYRMAKAAGVYFIGVQSDFASLNINNSKYKIYSILDIPTLFGL